MFEACKAEVKGPSGLGFVSKSVTYRTPGCQGQTRQPPRNSIPCHEGLALKSSPAWKRHFQSQSQPYMFHCLPDLDPEPVNKHSP